MGLLRRDVLGCAGLRCDEVKRARMPEVSACGFEDA